MVKKSVEGNISFVMGTAGYLLAGEVVKGYTGGRKWFTQLTIRIDRNKTERLRNRNSEFRDQKMFCDLLERIVFLQKKQ